MDAIVPQTLTPVTLPLSVGDVQTAEVDGEASIVFRHAVESLGMSYPRQTVKLRDRSWANCAVKATVAQDGKIHANMRLDIPPREHAIP